MPTKLTSLCILFIVFTNNVLAQDKTFVIVDGSDGFPLSFVTVKILNQNRGFHADSNGLVKLPINLIDTILIEHSGYFSLKAKVDLKKDTFFLNRKIYQLTPIIIGKFKNERQVGNLKFKRSFSVNISNAKEYALKIDLSTIKEVSIYKVRKIYLPIEFDGIESNSAYCKIHLYKANEKGEPAEDLLTKPVIIDKNYKWENGFYVDISEQNLILSEEILFLGIECIIDPQDYSQNKKTSIKGGKDYQIKLFCTGKNQFFDTSFNHTFLRLLDSKHYVWSGSKNSIYPPSFSAGLVIITH